MTIPTQIVDEGLILGVVLQYNKPFTLEDVCQKLGCEKNRGNYIRISTRLRGLIGSNIILKRVVKSENTKTTYYYPKALIDIVDPLFRELEGNNKPVVGETELQNEPVSVDKVKEPKVETLSLDNFQPINQIVPNHRKITAPLKVSFSRKCSNSRSTVSMDYELQNELGIKLGYYATLFFNLEERQLLLVFHETKVTGSKKICSSNTINYKLGFTPHLSFQMHKNFPYAGPNEVIKNYRIVSVDVKGETKKALQLTYPGDKVWP